MKRTYLGCQVYNIAQQHDVPNTLVHRIITTYIEYLKECLFRGERIDIYGLVSIVPDVITAEYNKTLAYDCYIIADMLGLPRYTVYAIIKAYIEDAKASIMEGTIVELRSLVTIKPYLDSKGEKLVSVNSSVSQSLKNRLGTDGCVINSFRVHTYKVLRELLATNES